MGLENPNLTKLSTPTHIKMLTLAIGLISITSAYAKCDGGTEVTNSVGTTFCQSSMYLNWWSAAAWCKANGRQLAAMYEMCPSWDGNVGGRKCPELMNGSGSGEVWSATARGSKYAFRVLLASGELDYHSRQEYHYAFCR